MSQLNELADRKVLVTGGAGFVGSNVVRRLLGLGASVIVLDDFFTGTESNLPQHDRLQVVRGTVCDLPLVRDLVKRSDLIIHEAARNIIVSTRNPREDLEVNIGGTLNLLLAVREFKTPRMVYASSASLYGNSRNLPTHEDDGSDLLSPYAVSKCGGENYCKAFHEAYGVPTTAVRYSNIYGPAQRPDNPYCGVVAKFFHAATNGQALQIHGDGEQTRDFTYVEDAVEATLLAAISPRATGQIFNVGTGRETSVNQLAHLIIEITAARVEPVYIDRRDIDNIRRRVMNIDKIRQYLRWIPMVGIERGLRKTYQWMLDTLQADPARKAG